MDPIAPAAASGAIVVAAPQPPVALLLAFPLSLIPITEPTRLRRMSYAVFGLKKKKKN